MSRRLAAVMFTDQAGYTALMQRDEAAALRSRERHRAALERSVPGHGGEILQYFGDGSLSIFDSSVEAVEAAIEIQRWLAGEPPLRIGLHLGDIAYDEQGAYGDAINIASRLEALSVPGGILVSQKVFDEIRRHPQLAVVPAGVARLKNVRATVEVFALAVEGLRVPVHRFDQGDRAEAGVPTTVALPDEVRARLDDRTRQPHFSKATGTIPGRVPLIGRDREIAALRIQLDQAQQGRGSTVFFRGPRGVGKTRFGHEAAEYAKGHDWTVLAGRAHPAAARIPFAPYADAFLPVLMGLDHETLARLVPGGEDALYSLFPGLGPSRKRLPETEGQPGEPQARLFWHFANFVARLAEYRPLLLILEDIDYADSSSIELFHFLARQCTDKSVCLIGQYTGSDRDRREELLAVEQSLVGVGAATVFQLEPLGRVETEEFIRRALDVEGQDIDRLASLVHGWTGGNPFFLMGTLRGLVESRVLRREEGVWTGLDVDEIHLPHSLRDAVVSWLGNLSDRARNLARIVAIVGTRVTYEVLERLWDEDTETLSDTLDELQRHQIFVDAEERFTLVYDFRHPLIRESLRSELFLSQRRLLHRDVATRLEAHYGSEADLHAPELAYHFGQANPGEAGAKAIHYLATAGYDALARYANQEAVGYLQEALDRIEARRAGERDEETGHAGSAVRVMVALTRARRRLGSFRSSVAIGRRVLAMARSSGEPRSIARAHREIGLSLIAWGLFEEAIEELDRALEAARRATDVPLMIHVLLALGFCYHASGDADRAEAPMLSALSLAEGLDHPELLGRVHGALMRLHIWTGRLDDVRTHAGKALALARSHQDPTVEFWSQWAMGAMEGLLGNTVEMERRIERATELAEKIGSPLMHLEIVELRVELMYARGEWTEGIAAGGRAIDLARSLDARMILPRLLVWVSFMHIGRGDLDVADALTREAWKVAGADEVNEASRYVDVHTIVPAHIGRAAYHLARGEWTEAARVAEAGLAIADRTGYVVWAIHHILPIIAEAAIHARNLGRAREVGARMRSEAEAMGHQLGLAWADACDALLTWLEGDAERGASALRLGAEAMERIPLLYEATRLRRQLAGRLAEIGDHEGALTELRHVHAVFGRLGAKVELERTRHQLAELGSPPLPLPQADGA